jgi:hypothetical protein
MIENLHDRRHRNTAGGPLATGRPHPANSITGFDGLARLVSAAGDLMVSNQRMISRC